MKKEMILSASPVQPASRTAMRLSVWTSLQARILRSAPLQSLSTFYSRLLEMHVTPLQTFRLLHAQLAFLALVFPCSFSVLVRFLFLGWFVLCVLRCRRCGLK